MAVDTSEGVIQKKVAMWQCGNLTPDPEFDPSHTQFVVFRSPIRRCIMSRSLIARGPVAVLLVLFLSAAPATAQTTTTYTWTGAADTSWFEALNWSAVGPAGPLGPPLANLTNTVVVLAGNTRTTNEMDISVETNSLTFAAGAGAFIVNNVGPPAGRTR